RVARRLLPPVLEVVASDASIEEKVRRVIALELSVLSEAPDLPGYVLSELHHHPERAEQLMKSLSGLIARQLGKRVLARLGEQLAAEARAGRLRPISAEQFMVNLVSLCM